MSKGRDGKEETKKESKGRKKALKPCGEFLTLECPESVCTRVPSGGM
jgi:hypothetical protein